MAIYTLDTSAVLAYVRGEPGEDSVEQLLRQADADGSDSILLPFVVLMEVEYILLRELPEDRVNRSLRAIGAWPMQVVESDEPWRRMAAYVKAQGNLSLGDSWVAALALLKDAELVHKDPEFDAVDGLKALRLPYDRDAGGQN